MYQTPYVFPNPYQQNTQIMPMNHTQQVIRVHGRNGADTYQMMPNSSVLLLDELAPIVYLAQTDGAGYKTITAYDIQAHQELPPVDTRSLEQRITKIEEMLNNESYSSNTKQGKCDPSKSGKADGSNAQSNKQSTSNG